MDKHYNASNCVANYIEQQCCKTCPKYSSCDKKTECCEYAYVNYSNALTIVNSDYFREVFTPKSHAIEAYRLNCRNMTKCCLDEYDQQICMQNNCEYLSDFIKNLNI